MIVNWGQPCCVRKCLCYRFYRICLPLLITFSGCCLLLPSAYLFSYLLSCSLGANLCSRGFKDVIFLWCWWSQWSLMREADVRPGGQEICQICFAFLFEGVAVMNAMSVLISSHCHNVCMHKKQPSSHLLWQKTIICWVLTQKRKLTPENRLNVFCSSIAREWLRMVSLYA